MTRALVSVALVALCGCASAMNGSNVSFTLRSVPDGAHFEVRDAATPSAPPREGTTPYPLYLPRGAGFFTAAKYQIALSKEGYESRTIQLRSFVSGWWFVNLLFLPPGWFAMAFIDPANGAMWGIDTPAQPIALPAKPASQ